MSIIIKKLLNFQKRKKGNISILVLIMGLAVILLTTAMVGYIFHDIGFVELDKGELRALHFAESGLSDMYYKIEQYNKGSLENLPDSPYTLDIGDPDPEGSFNVEYTMEEEGLGDIYTIISTGVDINSGVTRKVEVVTIYTKMDGFICGRASGAAQIAGQISITGPFFVDYIGGIFLGNSSFKKGPLFVKNDINMSGSSSIGEPEGEGYGPIILVMGGDFYCKGELVEDPLKPPSNCDVHVSEYYYLEDIDITLPTIDSSYINSVVNSGAIELPGDLFIGDGEITVNNQPPPSELDNYLRFNGSNVLEISGNIVVYGNIEIGTKKDTIEYSGNANLISTEDIIIEAKVRPENMNNFPSTDLMALISQYNIDIYANKGKYDKPDVAVMLIANNKIETQSTNTYLRGGTVSSSLVLGMSTEIYYETGIGEALTAGIPGFGENIKLQTKWEEIIAD